MIKHLGTQNATLCQCLNNNFTLKRFLALLDNHTDSRYLWKKNGHLKLIDKIIVDGGLYCLSFFLKALYLFSIINLYKPDNQRSVTSCAHDDDRAVSSLFETVVLTICNLQGLRLVSRVYLLNALTGGMWGEVIFLRHIVSSQHHRRRVCEAVLRELRAQ